MPDRLRALWDFEDVGGSETRLREQLEREGSAVGRAEVLTQLARVHSLRDEFDECETLLQRAESLAGDDGVVRVRVDLERGRKLRSSGEGAAAAPLFESAFARASELGEYWLAGDAAHMVAISVPDRMVEWSDRGLALAESQPEASYWAGPLLNNLGWPTTTPATTSGHSRSSSARSRYANATRAIRRRSGGPRKRLPRRGRRSAASSASSRTGGSRLAGAAPTTRLTASTCVCRGGRRSVPRSW